ncbi:MAG: metallophosphoesterase family protein [Verrucomicrobiota bacterium]|jgi:predicted phosphodiesterase/NTP pyrophosphatase (non-canonical NTP hydrolase)
MKLLIVSDIHGNWPALQAVLQAEPDADQILCLGDLVNYGPQPVECVQWAMQQLGPEWLIQGNHDRAVGRDEEPNCSVSYQDLAAATQAVSARLLSPELKRFLATLEPLQRFQLGEAVFAACHAIPSDPLYHYLPENSPITLWESELNTVGYPDFLLLGHTHVPMKTRFRRTLVVNPGSVGQPRHGDPNAAYAIWVDGEVVLRRAPYKVEQTIRAYDGLGLDRQTVEVLGEVLRTGGHLPLDQTPTELLSAFYQKHPEKLEAMFYLQRLLNRRIGVDTDRLTEAERQQWVLNYCRAMVQEVAELTDCVPWKWWASYQQFDKQNARVEIADLLHFLISLAQVMEITSEELFDLYIKKHRLNLTRQDAGYTVKDETDNRPI